MCGDGANDCGALKTADVGISLSEAEASVASPFTSAQADISCVPKVIKEGRAALVTAFGLFKYMVLYSMTQFFSTEVLYTYGTRLTDFEFLFIDGFLTLFTAFFFGQTRPYRGPLVERAPNASLLSVIPVTSMLFQFLLMALVQVACAQIVVHLPWSESHMMAYVNYAVYTVSQFQYLILAVTFSFGKPYREPFTRNRWFFITLMVQTVVCSYVTLYPWKYVEKLFELTLPPTIDFRLVIVALALANFVASIFLESFVVNYVLERILSSPKFHDLGKHPLKKRGQNKSELFVKTNGGYISQIEVKSYGTMRS